MCTTPAKADARLLHEGQRTQHSFESQLPHETTMKPVMKPLVFYRIVDETGGFLKI